MGEIRMVEPLPLLSFTMLSYTTGLSYTSGQTRVAHMASLQMFHAFPLISR